MKRVGLGTLAALVMAAIAVAPGCSSSDAGDGAAPGALDASADTNIDLCGSFSGSGTICPYVSTTTMCSPDGCSHGPCYCVQGPNGPRWTCVNGECGAPVKVPPVEAGPGVDGSPPPPSDASTKDTSAPVDTGPPPVDTGPPPVDTGPPPVDSAPPDDAASE